MQATLLGLGPLTVQELRLIGQLRTESERRPPSHGIGFQALQKQVLGPGRRAYGVLRIHGRIPISRSTSIEIIFGFVFFVHASHVANVTGWLATTGIKLDALSCDMTASSLSQSQALKRRKQGRDPYGF